MTDEEALAEARRRWGEAGQVVQKPGRTSPYRVGTGRPPAMHVRGSGASWEEAFHDADQLEAHLQSEAAQKPLRCVFPGCLSPPEQVQRVALEPETLVPLCTEHRERMKRLGLLGEQA